jgi:2-iminobutanoate/2-iminopropanoate deaminase
MATTQIRETIHSKPGGFSHHGTIPDGVKAGGLLFVSGVRGQDPASNEMSDDPKEQARQAFSNLQDLLEGAGATMDHVAKVTLFLSDLNTRQAFHEVWQEVFPDSAPARIAIQVADANAVPGRNAHFALDVIAVAP